MNYVEVKGIGFPNKGADLLASAIYDQLNKRGYTMVMEPYGSYWDRAKYGAGIKTRIDVKGINVLSPLSIFPKYVRDRMGWVNRAEIGLVLDASGYAYGDEWSKELADQRILNEIKKLSKVVMLPQTFGPFEKRSSKDVMGTILNGSAKVYAREGHGAQLVKDHFSTDLEVIPDITFGLDVDKAEKEGAIVIPNFQVLSRFGEKYLDLLTQSVVILAEKYGRVSLLNHEGNKDLEICKNVRSRALSIESGIQVDICNPKSGLSAKKLISRSRFVLTSRYHGLVSSLATSTPVTCIGWSFKYEEVLKLFDLEAPEAGNGIPELSAITDMFDPDGAYVKYFSSDDYQEKLFDVKAKVEEMWDEVLGG